MPELVDCLFKVVEVQMADLRHAFHNQGNYTLQRQFTRFRLNIDEWNELLWEDKDEQFNK